MTQRGWRGTAVGTSTLVAFGAWSTLVGAQPTRAVAGPPAVGSAAVAAPESAAPVSASAPMAPSTAAPATAAPATAAPATSRPADSEPRIGQKLTKSGFPEPPPPPPPTDAAPKRVYEDATRLRGGVGLAIGTYVFETSVPVLGVEGRIGAQFNDWFGLYAAPGFLSGVDPDSGAALGRLQLGIMPEFTLAGLFFLGLGPEVYSVFGGDAVGPRYADLLYVGARLRTGVAIGRRVGDHRHAFTIGLDFRVDAYRGGAAIAPTLGLGYDAF